MNDDNEDSSGESGPKVIGKPFTKGNKFGKGFIGKGIVEARKLNRKRVENILNKYIHMSATELQEFVQANVPSRQHGKATAFDPSIEVLIATFMLKAIQEGDLQRLNFILDRLIGKVVDKIEIEPPKPTVIKLIGDEAEAIVLGSEKESEDDGE